jgi:uncharacterized protein YukE
MKAGPRGKALGTAALFVMMTSLGAPFLTAQTTPPRMHQQVQEMHQRTQQLTEVMQRMQRVQQRAHDMEQMMLREMEQLRQREMLQEQDQLRLREQERIRDMAHSMANAAGEMNQAMERFRDLARDSQTLWNRDMERDMERLREHMDQTCVQMEEGLKIMDRLRERLHTS